MKGRAEVVKVLVPTIIGGTESPSKMILSLLLMKLSQLDVGFQLIASADFQPFHPQKAEIHQVSYVKDRGEMFVPPLQLYVIVDEKLTVNVLHRVMGTFSATCKFFS